MSTTLYKKVGEEFVPVAEYAPELFESFHKGAHLVISEPGVTIYRHNIDPNHAAIAAAGALFADDLAKELVKSSFKIRSEDLTTEQVKMWCEFISSVLSSAPYINSSSYSDIANDISNNAKSRMEQILKVPAVQKAYDHFLLMCKMVEETK